MKCKKWFRFKIPLQAISVQHGGKANETNKAPIVLFNSYYSHDKVREGSPDAIWCVLYTHSDQEAHTDAWEDERKDWNTVSSSEENRELCIYYY